MKDVSDNALVEAVKAGDLESFGQLAQRYYGGLVAAAYSVLHDHHLAEDAAQEGLARALVKIRGLRDPEQVGPWLRRICQNTARNMVRKRPVQACAEDLAPAVTDERREDLSLVRKAILDLSPVDREIIMLRFYNDSSYQSMAQLLGLTQAAINGRITRAKRKIADTLRRIGFTEDLS